MTEIDDLMAPFFSDEPRGYKEIIQEMKDSHKRNLESLLDPNKVAQAKEELYSTFEQERLNDRPLLVRAARRIGRAVGLVKAPNYEGMARNAVGQDAINLRAYELHVDELKAVIPKLEEQVSLYDAEVSRLSDWKKELRSKFNTEQNYLSGMRYFKERASNQLTVMQATLEENKKSDEVYANSEDAKNLRVAIEKTASTLVAYSTELHKGTFKQVRCLDEIAALNKTVAVTKARRDMAYEALASAERAYESITAFRFGFGSLMSGPSFSDGVQNAMRNRFYNLTNGGNE